jgi:hypothetical protein
MGLMPLATPAYDGTIDDLPSKRTRIQDRVVREDFRFVRHCAGTHIHVEQVPGREIDQVNTLTALDPALALVNSSPFYGHQYLAASARSRLYRWKAYQHLPRQGRLWPYAKDTEEWAKRIERRYNEFVTEAVMAGFDRDAVESCFDPEGAVWAPVQLRQEFSTVEWRSPDTALPSQIMELTEQVIDVMGQVGETPVTIGGDSEWGVSDSITLPPFETVEEVVKKAVEEGIASETVRTYLGRLGFDITAFEPRSGRIATESLTAEEAARLRLASADRLEADVARHNSVRAD